MAESIVQVTEGSGKKLHTFQRTIGANSVEDEVTLLGESYLATYQLKTGATSGATLDSHLLQIMAGASLNVFVRRIRVYQVAAATTAALVGIDVIRLTTAGTGGTAQTFLPLDPADAAAGATAMTLPTVKGTEAAGPIDGQMTVTLQTVAATTGIPNLALLADFDYRGLHGKSLKIAAGAANGIAVKIRNAAAAMTCIIVPEIVEANFS